MYDFIDKVIFCLLCFVLVFVIAMITYSLIIKPSNNTCIIEMKDSIMPGTNCEIKNEGRCVYYKDRGTKSYICGEFKLYIQEDN